MRSNAAMIIASVLAGCGRHVIQVIPDGTNGGTVTADPTFEIVARVAGAHDPLPVAGASTAYTDLGRSLGQAVVRAVVPRHDMVLTVELIAADADYHGSRLAVSMVARATLRTRLGNAFVGQTQAVCRDGAIVDPDNGAKVMWSCMTQIAHDLAGWMADTQ